MRSPLIRRAVLLVASSLMAAGTRADLVLNSFESPSSTSFYDWIRTPSKSPECLVLADCGGAGGPCASAYQATTAPTEGLLCARVHLQPEETTGLNCVASSSCVIERFRALTLYNFSPRDWSTGYTRLAIDVRRQGTATAMFFRLRVEDTSGIVATGAAINLTATMNGTWFELGFPVSQMSAGGVNTASLKAVCLVLPIPTQSPYTCATAYLDNLRLVPGTPPCPPTAMSAVATGTIGQIRLGWTVSCAGTDPTVAYRVYRSTAVITTLPAAPVATVATQYTDTGLVNGITYHYKVVAVDALGSLSAASDPADDDADTPWGCVPLAEIPSLSVTVAVFSASLSWPSPPVGSATVVSYEVLRSTFAASPGLMTVVSPPIPHSGPGTYGWTDPGVTPGGSYCWRVRAVEVLGCSSTSPQECRMIPCNLTPPPGLSGLGFCDRIRLTWGVISSTEYRIYRSSTGAACTGALVASPLVGTTSWDDLAVVDGVNYSYAITAWSPTCESVCSAAQYVAFDAAAACLPCIPPGAIGGPGVAAGSRRVTVTWTRPAPGGTPLSRYFVWLGAGSTGSLAGKFLTATVWDQPGGPVFSVTIAGLALDTTYCAIVEAIDGGSPGCTSFSGEACATTGCVTPPAPSISTVLPIAAGMLAVTWPRPAGQVEPLSRYLIMRATAAGAPLSIAATIYDAPVAGFTFTDTGLASPLTHCYRILETDEAGCTVWSAEVCASCSPPGPPLALTAMPLTASSIMLGWTPSIPGVLGVSRYEVYRATFTGGTKPLVGTAWGPAAGSFLDAPVNAIASWFYLVRAVDEAGCAAVSAEQPYVYLPPGAAPVTLTALLSAGGLHLDWAPVASGTWSVTAYVVWRASVAAGPYLVAATIWHDPGQPGFTLTEAGMALDRPWSYRLAVRDELGGSTWSGPFTYLPAPPTWTLNDPVMTLTQSGTTAVLSWDAAIPGWLAVSRYHVYRSTNGATCAAPLALAATIWDGGATPRFTLTDTGLDPLVQSGYRVLAIDLGGNTLYSACSAGPPPPGTCSFTSQPSASVQPGPTGTPSIRLAWGVTSTGSGGTVTVWRGEGATGGTGGKIAVATLPLTQTSWLDTGVVAGKTYCYVLVLDVPGIACTSTSGESCGQTAALLVTVYPNPAEPSKGPVRFDGLPAGSTVEVFTVNGDRVIASPVGSAPLWLWDGKTAGGSPAAPGIYLYLIRGSGSPQRGTLVLGK